ncbi:MAG: hypothetical protein M5U34_23845 [Chloroflexi bacterium]|nr:hypothetical protein [Chloroflexota bacterium]
MLQAYRDRTLADTGPIYPAMTLKSVPVVEQDTQFYVKTVVAAAAHLDDDQQDTPIRAAKPVRASQPHTISAAAPTLLTTEDPDWTILGLGIAALIMLLGLIPLWFFVYRAWAG